MSPHPRDDVVTAPDARADRSPLLSLAQAVVAGWLVVSPFVLTGPSGLVAAKDLLVGATVLTVSLAALARVAGARLEAAVCAVAGAVLILASIAVEFGPGPEAAARQWSEVVAGVLLVCLAAARAR